MNLINVVSKFKTQDEWITISSFVASPRVLTSSVCVRLSAKCELLRRARARMGDTFPLAVCSVSYERGRGLLRLSIHREG